MAVPRLASRSASPRTFKYVDSKFVPARQIKSIDS